MKKYLRITAGCIFIFLMNPFVSTGADFGGVLKRIQGAVGGSSGTSQGEIVSGLKEALAIGTANTVQALSQVDGYYKNPKVRIPLPGSIRNFEKILRATGFGSQVDAFELSMNRAAEKAAPKAKTLFVDAIKQMTFSDAQAILNGPNNAATVYFQSRTEDKLQTLFKPIVKQSMEKVGVTQYYQAITEKIQSLPFAGNYLVDLDSYVTEKAIDGLFIRLAEEEAKIRTDPAARVTDLLKEVFGKR